MNLVLEPRLNTTRKRFRLLSIGNAEIAGYHCADLVRSTRSPEFAYSVNNRADVSRKLRRWFLAFCGSQHFDQQTVHLGGRPGPRYRDTSKDGTEPLN